MAFVCEAMAQTELGNQLRRARENKGVSLEDIEKATGIRKRYLAAMEEGRFDALPGQIQLRGFLRNYANYVGLNGDEMLSLYERRSHSAQMPGAFQPTSAVRPVPAQPASSNPQSAAPQAVAQSTRPTASSPPVAQPQLTRPPAPRPSPTTSNGIRPDWMSRLPPWLTLEVILMLLAALLVICVAVLLLSIFVAPGATQSLGPVYRPTATRMRIAPTLLPTAPAATPVSTSLPNITSSVKLTTSVGYVQVALAATEHVWVRVTTDGRTAFEGMFKPGDALNWEAKEMIVVESGNGAGLAASFNGKPVGVLGPRGQVVARAWTPDGETAPPKPTASVPTPSPTP
jgi:hypothetical protein